MAYNRLISNSKCGVGVSTSFIDIGTQKLGGIMPAIDIRYYSKFGRSTIIPLAQVGYNFYKFSDQTSTNVKYDLKGGLGYSIGIGYSYGLTPKGSGPFGAVKFRGLQYKYTEGSTFRQTSTREQVTLSVGWRF